MAGVVCPAPVFSIGELAKVFLNRSPHWIRWAAREGKFDLDGIAGDNKRNENNARRYDLADVEKIAHALASNNMLSGSQLRLVLLMVKTRAEIQGVL